PPAGARRAPGRGADRASLPEVPQDGRLRGNARLTMYYELALISVVIAGGYWGWFFARQRRARLYAAMQLGAAAAAGLVLLGRRVDAHGLVVVGAIGVGAGACLLIVGPMVRGMARRMATAERFGLAQALLEIADVLAPGSGVGEEKALLGAMREIRDGNI